MKKTFFIAAVVCIILIACKNPLKPDVSKAATSSFNVGDSIPSIIADSMITHYLDSAVDHSLGSLVLQVSLYNSDLYAVFNALSTKNKPITRIRLLDAAYLATDSVVARRNHPTVLLQLKIGYHSDYYYYDVQSFGDGRLCPPPMGCSTVD